MHKKERAAHTRCFQQHLEAVKKPQTRHKKERIHYRLRGERRRRQPPTEQHGRPALKIAEQRLRLPETMSKTKEEEEGAGEKCACVKAREETARNACRTFN